MWSLVFLLIGIAGLVVASNLVIKGAMHIAERLKLSHVFVGLTLLTLGTNLPELLVATTAGIHMRLGAETSGLIIGTSLGPCFGQIALTLGLVSLLSAKMFIKKSVLMRDGIVMIFSVILLIIASVDGVIDIFDGLVFLVVYAIYLLSVSREEQIYEKVDGWVRSRLSWSIVSIIAGFVILGYCANIVVENAIVFSKSIGVAQSVIGITIVGVGASLPELVVALSALKNKSLGLSVGNLIGSNIFDILVIMGVGSTISRIAMPISFLYFDLPFLLATSIAAFFFFRNDRKIVKWEAAVLVGLFAAYMALKVLGL